MPALAFYNRSEEAFSRGDSGRGRQERYHLRQRAVAIPWSVNKSILWAIIHGLFSWVYVVYYALFKR